jgi:dephospho-CoA kinase
MKVIVLTGMPGSGKEEFVSVARQVGYDIVRMGDVVRAEAAKRGVADGDKTIGGFAHAERQAHGYDIWAKRCLKHITAERTIIDGSRGRDELKVFRAQFGPDVLLVAIHAAPALRFQRLQERDRPDAPRTWEEFAERDERELAWGLGNLIVMADRMIVNEDTLHDFKDLVRRFLEALD